MITIIKKSNNTESTEPDAGKKKEQNQQVLHLWLLQRCHNMTGSVCSETFSVPALCAGCFVLLVLYFIFALVSKQVLCTILFFFNTSIVLKFKLLVL